MTKTKTVESEWIPADVTGNCLRPAPENNIGQLAQRHVTAASDHKPTDVDEASLTHRRG